MTPEQTFELAKAVLLAVVTVVTGAVGACITFWLKRPEIQANVRKVEVDTDKTEAEVNALQLKTFAEMTDVVMVLYGKVNAIQEELAILRAENARLRLENTELSAKNTALEAKITAQAGELADLRRRIEDYEERLTQSGKAMTEGAH